MQSAFELTAELREDKGKGASRRLRHQGKVPAVLYGGGRNPRAITLEQRELLHHMENESFYSTILSVTLGDEKQAAILKDLQRHPAKNLVMHIDLQRVVADQKIRVTVPLHFIGEDVCVGVKDQGGQISHIMSDVEITCLPKNLPEFIEVDVTTLELNQMLRLTDITLPEGVEIPEILQEEFEDRGVVSIHHIREVEEDVEEEEVVEEGELLAEGAEEAPEGEAPAATEGGDEETSE